MARIRTIKPEFWQNEDLSGVSIEAALLAVALLNMADDEGWFQAHPIRVKVCCFPGRDGVNVAGALDELERIGYIERAVGTDSGSLETEWSRYKQQLHTAFSLIVSGGKND